MKTHQRPSLSAVVIGSGVGGMAAAIRLAMDGQQVTLFEAAKGPGGKLREKWVGPYRFDRGPSLFTWPDLLMELDQLVRSSPFVDATRLPKFEWETLDRSTHYFWEDGNSLVAWADSHRFAEEAAKEMGIAPSIIQRHLRASQRNFEGTRGVFLEQPLMDVWRHGPRNGWSSLLKALPRLPLFGTLHGLNRRRLAGNPKLVQLFDRYATYNGSDPYRAPAMLDVIPHLEHGMGTHFPKRGMYGITEHLHRLAEAAGVRFIFNTPVARILHHRNRVQGVELTSGQIHKAECIISNADVHPTYRKLLPNLPAPERILSQERSTSGLIFYWGVNRTFPELHLHNILFSRDYQQEFRRIKETGTPGDDPTVYINITSKLRTEDAPIGGENWFVLINVSAQPERFEEAIEVERMKQQVLGKIERTLQLASGSLIRHIEEEDILRPSDIERKTSSWLGALYGASSNSAFSAFLRHRNRSKDLSGLYFCGGSVHPGGGIPLCLLSGKIAAECAHMDSQIKPMAT